jgi:hypothetical protein
MKAIKIMIAVLSISVVSQMTYAQNCKGNTVLMSKGAQGCGCHCQKKCVSPADVQTYLNNGWHYGDCFGSCCWVRLNSDSPASETALKEIYRNPASGSLTISFTLAHQGEVSLEVFNAKGRYVNTITHNIFTQENNQVTWDASAVNQGVYLLKMKAGSYRATKKIFVIN